MPIGVELCMFCKHWRGPGCKAFPEDVPEEVFYGKHDHRKPYPGDNDIQFELDPNLAPAMRKMFGEYFEDGFEIYKDRAGAYRFRSRDKDGEILAMSGKSYQTKAACQKAIEAIKKDAFKSALETWTDQEIRALLLANYPQLAPQEIRTALGRTTHDHRSKSTDQFPGRLLAAEDPGAAGR